MNVMKISQEYNIDCPSQNAPKLDNSSDHASNNCISREGFSQIII